MRVLSFIVFGAVVALVVPSMAKDKQIPEAILIFTDNYATALGLEAACPTWRVDRAKAASALAVSGLPDNAYEVPGPLHDRFMESGTRAKKAPRWRATPPRCFSVPMEPAFVGS
jgi:hypothetical protein